MRKTKTIICLTFLSIFIASTVYAQNTNEVYQIDVPDKLGKVKERFKGTSDSIIIHIQDAHTSVEAQENIANIIEFFIRGYDVNVVGTEGASGPIDLSEYREYPFKSAVKEAAKDMIKEGYFSGGEYAQIVASKLFDFNGLEDTMLMKENYKAYLKSIDLREKAYEEFTALDDTVLQLEKQILNEDMQAFLQLYESYEDKMIDFIDYSVDLITKAQELEIDLFDYVQLKQYTDYIKEKDSIDLDKLEEEKEALMKIFDKRSGELDEDTNYLKLKKAMSGENKLFTSREIEEFVVVLARKFSVPEEQYENLKKNVEVERRFQLFNIGLLLQEADGLSYVVLDKLAGNETEKKLIEIRRGVKTILKMIGLDALKHDTEYFRKNKDTFKVNEWYAFIEGEAKKTNTEIELKKGLVDYAALFEVNGTYYKSAIERDVVLSENMIKLVNEKGAEKAIMVAGGYHTQGITDYFRKVGQAYIVIMPRITTAAEDLPLEKRLSGELFGVDMLEVLENE